MFVPLLFVGSIIYLLGAIFAEKIGSRRGLWLLLIGLVLTFAPPAIDRVVQYPATGGAFFIMLITGLPLLLIGFGSTVSSIGSRLPNSRYKPLLKAGVVAAPIALLSIYGMNHTARLRAATADHAERIRAFQQTNIQLSFDGIQLTLPVSPSITIENECNHPDGQPQWCWSNFKWSTRLHQYKKTQPPAVINKIMISRAGPETNVWCAMRDDIDKDIWCKPSQFSEIQFTLKAPHEPTEGWRKIANMPEVLAYCKTRHGSTICFAYFTVADGVFASTYTTEISPSDLPSFALAAQSEVLGIWHSIQNQPVLKR